MRAEGAPGRAAPDKGREQLGPPGEKVAVCPPCATRPEPAEEARVRAGEEAAGAGCCGLGRSPRESRRSESGGDGGTGEAARGPESGDASG